jgi:hypothetical protein
VHALKQLREMCREISQKLLVTDYVKAFTNENRQILYLISERHSATSDRYYRKLCTMGKESPLNQINENSIWKK